MFTHTHGIMHHNITMTFQRWITAACMCCMLGVGTATAAPFSFYDAKAAYHKGDYAQAIEIFRPLAAQGNPGAQAYLGLMYVSGEGVTQDYQEAVKWSRLAAAQENAGAQFNLGWMYEHGRGVTQDHQEALKWYRLAAAQGDAPAQTNIGVMYHNGDGVTRDYQEAVKWYRLAAARGHERAKEALERPDMVAAAKSPGTKWAFVGSSEISTGYADPATIRRAGNRVKMWSLYNYKTTQKTDDETYISTRSRNEYDCKEEQTRILYFSAHSGNMGGGVTVSHSPNSSGDWTPIAPGSVAESFLKIACGAMR